MQMTERNCIDIIKLVRMIDQHDMRFRPFKASSLNAFCQSFESVLVLKCFGMFQAAGTM